MKWSTKIMLYLLSIILTCGALYILMWKIASILLFLMIVIPFAMYFINKIKKFLTPAPVEPQHKFKF